MEMKDIIRTSAPADMNRDAKSEKHVELQQAITWAAQIKSDLQDLLARINLDSCIGKSRECAGNQRRK